MCDSTEYFNIPALAPELRVNIYHEIIADAIGTPTLSLVSPYSQIDLSSTMMNAYSGLILSCKEIKNEFEREWVKAINPHLNKVVGDSGLRPVPVTSFQDSRNCTFLIDNNQENKHRGSPLDIALLQLPLCFRSFKVRLNDTFTPHDGTLRGFVDSEQFSCLTNLQECITWRARPREVSVCTRVDYVASELQVYCQQEVLRFEKSSEVIFQVKFSWLPFGIRDMIYAEVLAACTSSQDLLEYHKLFNADAWIQQELRDVIRRG
jgi:hypothetical protein